MWLILEILENKLLLLLICNQFFLLHAKLVNFDCLSLMKGPKKLNLLPLPPPSPKFFLQNFQFSGQKYDVYFMPLKNWLLIFYCSIWTILPQVLTRYLLLLLKGHFILHISINGFQQFFVYISLNSILNFVFLNYISTQSILG